ncbi:MAG TPA: monofunctional biosynthetic peptidoglycan transglycosylase, partial [Dehalococcoidia bacterium]|nr:monofunctional biosynthetic peptidoglycan transglycosylase [Dehalococcoidia bacterium]
AKALKGVPEAPFAPPEGVVALNIDPETGRIAVDGPSKLVEYFYQENIPSEQDTGLALRPDEPGKPHEDIKNQLF